MSVKTRLHTVAETEPFIASAAKAGMTDQERQAAILQVASNPTSGDVIVGSGGVRKVRVAGRGFGRSGGYAAGLSLVGVIKGQGRQLHR